MIPIYLIILIVLCKDVRLERRLGLSNNNCSNSRVKINETFPEVLLTPTDNELYMTDMHCKWIINIDYYNSSTILKVDLNLGLSQQDRLVLTSCYNGNHLYDSNSTNFNTLYLQENDICIYFNSSFSEYGSREKVFYWSIHFLLEIAQIDKQIVSLTPDTYIDAKNQLNNYSMLYISSSDGLLQVYYDGKDPKRILSGTLYVYNSSNLTNFIHAYSYPISDIHIINDNASQVTLFYVGDPNNTIRIVSRIQEYHSANCNDTDNLLFSSNLFFLFKEISALSSGICTFTIIIPMANSIDTAYILYLTNIRYNGGSKFSVVSGYNNTYTLFEADNGIISRLPGNGMCDFGVTGMIVSFLIPPNSTLSSLYRTMSQPINVIITAIGDDIFIPIMSPNYPFLKPADYNIEKTVDYSVDYAKINLTIFADIPKNCYLTVYDDKGITHLNITNRPFTEYQISFNSTKFTIDFVSYNFEAQWQGFLVRVEGHRINPPILVNIIHKKGGLKEGLIIGLSCTALLIILIIIGFFTRYQLKKRYNKFDQLCNLLKDMNMSPDEILELKQKSDEFLILPSKIHINFDQTLKLDPTFTVYKGYLMGAAPLHILQRSIFTQRFVDCEVAVKVATRFGKQEVEELFKEIDIMKKIGYHENVMCMLGWALPGDMPCLAYDIADIDILSYVIEFRSVGEGQVPYKNFLSILWQVARGMQHIASKGIVHRNLSANKIWLFGTINAKISDLNFCCFCDENSSYKEKDSIEKFSMKQLALESLVDKVFSEKSDVWSFGILVYEMFCFGKVSYEDWDGEKLVEFLKDGHRLERLENMNETLYEILKSCWDVDPKARPDFKELEKKFHEFIEIRSELYGYVEARNFMNM